MPRRIFLTALIFTFLLIPEPLRSSTNVAGTITTDTTWDLSGSPFVVDSCSVSVASGATLTIAPGVVVQFQLPGSSCGGPGSLFIYGGLTAIGTAAQPITFTSIRDGAGAAPGDWGSIFFVSGATTSTISHVMLRYGGGIGFGMVQIQSGNSAPSLVSSTLTNTATGGGAVQVANGSSPTISGNTFSQNAVGVSISYASPNLTTNSFSVPSNGTGISAFGGTASITNNTLTTNTTTSTAISILADFLGSLSGNTATGTGLNAVAVQGGTLPASATWGQLSMPYAVASCSMNVASGATLTIAPGVVVQFQLPAFGCSPGSLFI